MPFLARLHDTTSRGLFLAAGASLALTVMLYLFEVCARYVFNAPTTWTSELVQYCLSAVIFLALPDITRRQAHILIDLIPQALSARGASILSHVNSFVAGIACASAGLIVAFETHKQFEQGLLTNAAHPIPRWWITAIIAVGLLSAALHFIRNAFAKPEFSA